MEDIKSYVFGYIDPENESESNSNTNSNILRYKNIIDGINDKSIEVIHNDTKWMIEELSIISDTEIVPSDYYRFDTNFIFDEVSDYVMVLDNYSNILAITYLKDIEYCQTFNGNILIKNETTLLIVSLSDLTFTKFDF